MSLFLLLLRLSLLMCEGAGQDQWQCGYDLEAQAQGQPSPIASHRGVGMSWHFITSHVSPCSGILWRECSHSTFYLFLSLFSFSVYSALYRALVVEEEEETWWLRGRFGLAWLVHQGTLSSLWSLTKRVKVCQKFQIFRAIVCEWVGELDLKNITGPPV